MKLTQVQFAEKIGTTQRVYTRYETGKLDIPDNLKKAIHSLGVNLNWLLTGEGDMFGVSEPIDLPAVENEPIAKTQAEQYIDTLLRIVESQQNTIAELVKKGNT